MKKILNSSSLFPNPSKIAATGAAVLLLAACNKGIESHYTDIIYPSTRSCVILADQTADSLVFASTDSWTLTCSAPSWCTFDPALASFVNKSENTWVVQKIDLSFTPNTTGKVRDCVLRIDGGESSNAAYYAQLPFLGIIRPQRIFSQDFQTDTIASLTIAADATTDSVMFRVYGDWTLQPSDGSWLSANQAEGTAGEQVVYLTVQKNASAERKDTLVLVSNGVTDRIPVVQQAPRVTE